MSQCEIKTQMYIEDFESQLHSRSMATYSRDIATTDTLLGHKQNDFNIQLYSSHH